MDVLIVPCRSNNVNLEIHSYHGEGGYFVTILYFHLTI